MIKKIISGGQTGADQAALDVAIKYNIPHGGWIPKGRLTEDGGLPTEYQLEEMPTESYSQRTEKNILDSDATLIVSHGKITGGPALTKKLAKQHNKQYLHLDMDEMSMLYALRFLKSWVSDNGIKILNVAGARASKDPNIYDATTKIIEGLLG